MRFEPALESEFRTTRLVSARRQIRYNLLLAAALIAAFAVMDRWLLGDSTQAVPDVLRFGVLVPLIALSIACTYAQAYARLYPLLMQIVAPLAGICVVLIETRAARAGIITGVLLATARVAGETAPLLFTALNNQFWSVDITGTVANLPVTINNFVQSPYEFWRQLAWTGALVITLAVLTLNIVARVFGRERNAK